VSDKCPSDGREATRNVDTASLLIERERDLFRIREETARNADAQATGITAASLAVAAVAAGGDVLSDAKLGWLILAGVLLLASAVAAGLARVPAVPPPRAIWPYERNELLDRYDPRELPSSPPFDTKRAMRRLGRDLGTAIRASEDAFRKFRPEDPTDSVTAQLLHHWRLRSSLARYRMHSKSAWLTASIVCLYSALVCGTASVLL
jgi:hypothetical protein